MNHMNFSVSMCVYGGDDSNHFDAALNSVICQTVRPTEIVLTVDGPIPEKTESVIENHRNALNNSDIAFKVIRLEKNQGHGEARRICFDNCSYELIALMDSDDLSVPERFEKQIEYFQDNPDVSVCGGYITEFISQADSTDISHQAGKRIVPKNDEEIKEYMKKRCPMNQVTVMFKKADIEEVGGYIDWYCEEDYYLWIRLTLAGKRFGNIQENLVNVRVGEDMYQRRGGLKYFKSEARLQKYMLEKKLVSAPRCWINISQRLVLQVLMPNSIRGFVFQKLARK